MSGKLIHIIHVITLCPPNPGMEFQSVVYTNFGLGLSFPNGESSISINLEKDQRFMKLGLDSISANLSSQ